MVKNVLLVIEGFEDFEISMFNLLTSYNTLGEFDLF